MAATAAAMKRIAEAADPLYKTLDDGQKRRLAILTRYGTPVRPRRLAAPRHGSQPAWTGIGIGEPGSWL